MLLKATRIWAIVILVLARQSKFYEVGLITGLGTSVAYAIVPKSSCGFIDIDLPDAQIAHGSGLKEIAVPGDALITHQTGVGLMLNPADCIPLVMYHEKSNILSLVHLGWRGAAGRLHQTVLDYVSEAYGARPSEVKAYLGPSISDKFFITEGLSDTQENDPEWKPFTPERADGFHINIPGFVIATLVKHGVPAANIVQSSADTGDPEQNYFSFTRHKREENTPDGRNGFATRMRL